MLTILTLTNHQLWRIVHHLFKQCMCQIILKLPKIHLGFLKNSDENLGESTSVGHDSTNSKNGQICDTTWDIIFFLWLKPSDNYCC